MIGLPVKTPSLPPPDSIIPFWKRPFPDGIEIKDCTETPPADSPKMVTLFGSPPNAAILFFTHFSAAI